MHHEECRSLWQFCQTIVSDLLVYNAGLSNVMSGISKHADRFKAADGVHTG